MTTQAPCGAYGIRTGFSTVNRVPHESACAVLTGSYLYEGRTDAAEATEEAVLSAMLCADTVKGLPDYLPFC